MKHFTLLLLSLSLLGSCSEIVELNENTEEVFYVRNEGADIPAFVYGNTASKTFLVVVHGGPGGNGLEYRDTKMEEIEAEFAVVYADQRGQGNSHGHYGTDIVTIDQLVSDLEGLIKTLNYRYGDNISIFMMGHSWGGTLGTAFMVTGENQNMLNGWIEADGAHDIPLLNQVAISMFINIGKDQLAQGKNTEKWNEIVDFAKGADSLNLTYDDGGIINSFGFEAEGILDEVTTPEESTYLPSRSHPLFSTLSGNATAGQLDQEIESTSLTNQLEKITIPTLLLWGKYDFVVPPRLGFSAYESISSDDKELVIFQNSGHSPMVNEPDKFNQSVISFIEQHR